MKENMIEKLQALENDAEFMAKAKAAANTTDLVKVLAEYGIEITEEEYENAKDQAVEILEQEGYIRDGELTEKGLEAVNGGVNTFVSGVGVACGSAGLMLMMAGGGPALWAVGCVIGVAGILMRGRRK